MNAKDGEETEPVLHWSGCAFSEGGGQRPVSLALGRLVSSVCLLPIESHIFLLAYYGI